jgi:hypothetical protein
VFAAADHRDGIDEIIVEGGPCPSPVTARCRFEDGARLFRVAGRRKRPVVNRVGVIRCEHMPERVPRRGQVVGDHHLEPAADFDLVGLSARAGGGLPDLSDEGVGCRQRKQVEDDAVGDRRGKLDHAGTERGQEQRHLRGQRGLSVPRAAQRLTAEGRFLAGEHDLQQHHGLAHAGGGFL